MLELIDKIENACTLLKTCSRNSLRSRRRIQMTQLRFLLLLALFALQLIYYY